MLKQIPLVTRTLLIVNVLFFLLTYFLEQQGIFLTIILGAFYPESLNFHFWQILTHMFMHGGIGHILFNMIALYLFGGTLERVIGARRFLFLFFVAGLGAFILFNGQNFIYAWQYKKELQAINSDFITLIHQQMVYLNFYGDLENPMIPALDSASKLASLYLMPMVGASGAIYGILVGFAFYFPNVKLFLVFLPFPIKAKYFIPGLMVVEIILGLLDYSWNPVAHFAHIGGAITGFIIVFYWHRSNKKYNGRL